MSKGKILQIAAVATTVDKQLRPLMEASIKDGYEVHIACADDGNVEKLKNEGFIIHKIHFDRKISLKSNFRSIKELCKLMKFYNYDIVHVHTPIASVLGRIAAKLSGVKNIIYTAHGYYFHDGMSKKAYTFYYQIEKQFAKFATDYLLLQSKEDYELSVQKRFKKKSKIIHLGNGIDIHEKFNPKVIKQADVIKLKKELDIKDSDFIFCFIGRFVREKGIYELLEAFNKLNETNLNIKLLMIGGLLESERDQKTSRAIKEWKKNKNIIFTGIRSDIPDLLSVSNVFVLPSYREGLPRSIIEAMAMEKAVIATNIRGCREEVINNKTGFLVEKQDADGLYQKMFALLKSKEMCIAFGAEARKIVENEYDEQKVLDKQLALFESILK